MEIIPQKPISFWFQYFEITMTLRQLDCEFENALENNKTQRYPTHAPFER